MGTQGAGRIPRRSGWVSGQCRASCSGAPESRGSTTWKLAPAPGALSTQMRPPWRSTMSRVMYRPSPSPPNERVARGGPVEAIEEPGLLLLRDPDPLVGDHQLHAVRMGAQSDLDPAAGGAVLDGVVEEVGEHLRQSLRIPAHPEGLLGDDEPEIVEGARLAVGLDHPLHQWIELLWLGVQQEPPVLDARGIQEIVDELGELADALHRPLDALRAHRFPGGELALQEAEPGGDGRERRLQLVRGDGEEVLADLHRLLGLDVEPGALLLLGLPLGHVHHQEPRGDGLVRARPHRKRRGEPRAPGPVPSRGLRLHLQRLHRTASGQGLPQQR